jgi:hypothetical protein
MRYIDYVVPGILSLSEDSHCSSMVAGDLIVSAGLRAEITGMVAGNLVVEPGAQVLLTGMVAGDLINRGGEVTGAGLVAGKRREEVAA